MSVSGLTLVTAAHGTRHPDGNRVAAELTAAAGAQLDLPALATYVELCEPLFADAMRRLTEPAVVVPLLLSTGYHVRVDLAEAVAAAPVPVRLGPALGPDRLLAAAQVDRLFAAGAEPGQPVVLVAAGSRDPAATPDLEGAAALLAQEWGGEVRLAMIAGIGQRPAQVVRPGDAVSPYLLSPGFFADRVRQESLAAGAALVADVIGAHPLVTELVCARVTQLRRT